MNAAVSTFNRRAFATIGAAVSGLGLPVTGYANHALQFSDMTLARHAWMAAHNSLGILFTGFAVWHIALNRRVLWQHVRGAAARVTVMNRELLVALSIIGVTTSLAVSHAFLIPTP